MSGSYSELIAWQKGMDMVEAVYRATCSFPTHELYSLTQQLHRAAISVPSNIAEGHARFSPKDFRHFLRQSRGSVAELETQLMLAQRLGYITDEGLRPLMAQVSEVGRVLTGLINSIDVE
jgi:four helix bundle protein